MTTPVADARHAIDFVLNGAPVAAEVAISTTAYDLLRESFRLRSVRMACDGIGMCGSCTILIDGRASPACLVLAVDLAGRRVDTVEGMADGERPHPLQRAFVEAGAMQCGYCTAGMLLAAKALLDETPAPTRGEIMRGLTGNLCRCTGYAKIVEAIAAVAAGTVR